MRCRSTEWVESFSNPLLHQKGRTCLLIPSRTTVEIFGDLSRYRAGVSRSFTELHRYLACIHSIKLRPHLHRALVLVEFLLDPGSGERRRKRFFADEEGAVKWRPWRAYLSGEDEGLVERLIKEEKKLEEKEMEVDVV